MKRKLNLILFINLIIQIFPKKIIEIPFKTFYPSSEKNISNYMSIMYNSSIGTEIEIGTPPQKFKALFYLQSFYTVILSNETKYSISPLFYQNLSSTYKSIKPIIGFFSEPFSDGEFAEDLITLGNKKYDKLKFTLTTYLSDRYDDIIHSSVLIGLKLKDSFPDQNFPEYTFLNQLKEKKLIDNYVFRFEFKSNKEEGKLIIGENPYDDENLLKINAGNFEGEAQLTGGIIFDNIYYGENKTKYNTKAIFKLDNEFIIGTTEIIDMIEKDFFAKFPDKCFKKDSQILSYKRISYYECEKTIDLNQMKNIIFEVKSINYSFVFEPKDLFIEYSDKLFFIITFSSVYTVKWTFGRYFLQKFSLYFDKDKKIIGFIPNKNGFGKFILPILLTIILIGIIVCLIYIIFGILKKKRRNRINELDDEFEYNPKE